MFFKDCCVITRFNLGDCADRVSDVAALRNLLETDRDWPPSEVGPSALWSGPPTHYQIHQIG